jgi:hypothetical protein
MIIHHLTVTYHHEGTCSWMTYDDFLGLFSNVTNVRLAKREYRKSIKKTDKVVVMFTDKHVLLDDVKSYIKEIK